MPIVMNDGSSPRPALWSSADTYDRYVGRWSRRVTGPFLASLGAPPRDRWLDVGCGTGALCERIVTERDPAFVCGVDPSAAFAASARANLPADRVAIAVGTASALPVASHAFDVAVSGLVWNFVPDSAAATSELLRVLRPGGTAALYIWDYAGEMQMMRYFWDAAAALDPAARRLDEANICRICSLDALESLLRNAGFEGVAARQIDVPTPFASFDDFWQPFLGGRAPAPAYALSLREDARTALRDELRRRLPVQADGSIPLIARALAVEGRAP